MYKINNFIFYMYIHQYQLDNLEKIAIPGKVAIIYGPRRIGKTTLLEKYLSNKQDYLFVNGEDKLVQQELSSQSIDKLKNFVGKYKLLVIDEAQVIENIGINLKLCIDHLKGLTIIATGSSSFDLNKEIGEPLTGRKNILKMFPLSQIELNNIENKIQTKENIENRLIYGSYPEVILGNTLEDKKDYLIELVNSYLCKDLLELEGLKKSKKVWDLLRLLALQLGSEVSHSELALKLGHIDKKTVEKYLDILEQSFILINVRGFSRNLRKEISKTSKYYFYDTGIRNALINNFNSLSYRTDIGGLWENYLIIERIKKQAYYKIYSQNFFWRTYDQQEIDWIEDIDGTLYAYEFKWQNNRKTKIPKAWSDTYKNSEFNIVNSDNYLEFIS